ncbi:hypothetical protein [Runella sp.]|uniref:hypothetical protein n=1 Tax=Runella sp. TaxID=1960881 RepID=UPI003D0C1EC5
MKKLLPVVLMITILLSCKEEAPTPDQTELLTNKTWKWVGGSISPAYDIFGIGILIGDDYFSRSPPCWQDDHWIFTAANKFSHEEGATKCNIADPQIYTQGSWAFEPGETTIKITEEGKPAFIWTINELTSTSLKVTEMYQEKGKTYTFQYSFSH